MKYIFSLIMILSLAACSSSSDDKSKNNALGGGDQGQMVNETDYSQCNGSPSPALTIDGPIWAIYQSQDELSLDMYMKVGNGSAQFMSQCSLKGRSLSASVTVPARTSSSSLEILGSGQREEKIDEPGFKLNCNVNVRQSVMSYRFKGRCLELSVQGQSQTILMVPVSI